MKTILGIYTKNRVAHDVALQKKRYSFNTNLDIKVGDLIKDNSYTTPIQVTDILEKTSSFVNLVTGQLSDTQGEGRVVALKVLTGGVDRAN